MKRRLTKLILVIFTLLSVIMIIIYANVLTGKDILLEQVSMIDPVTKSMLESSRISKYSNYEFAVLKILIQQGYNDVYYEIGKRYILGTGVVEDRAKGYKYMYLAVDMGDLQAMEFLGYMNDTGNYAYVREPEKAFFWYTMAANNGSASGAYRLCAAHIGNGEYEQAFGWCKYSADMGIPASQVTVGYMYAKGKGIEKDMSLAAKYICLAKNNGRISRHALEQYKISCE